MLTRRNRRVQTKSTGIGAIHRNRKPASSELFVSADKLAALQALGLHQFQFPGARDDHVMIRYEVDTRIQPFVMHGVEDHLHGIEAREMLIIGTDNGPGRVRGVGAFEHLVFLVGELIPSVLGLNVNLGELPLTQGIGLASLEPPSLFFPGYRKIQFHEKGALPHQIRFESGHADQQSYRTPGGCRIRR
jgi:hypothetical protein